MSKNIFSRKSFQSYEALVTLRIELDHARKFCGAKSCHRLIRRLIRLPNTFYCLYFHLPCSSDKSRMEFQSRCSLRGCLPVSFCHKHSSCLLSADRRKSRVRKRADASTLRWRRHNRFFERSHPTTPRNAGIFSSGDSSSNWDFNGF